MNGMSLVMSKPCCPMYKFGTSNKMDYLIPRGFSSNLLHFQGISTPVATTRRILKFRAFFYITPVNLAGLLVGPYLCDFMHGFAVVLHDKPFSIGDIIEVGSVKGRVIEFGLVTTLLLSAENVFMRVPNSVFCRKAIVNKSRARWIAMMCNIFVQVDDEIEKIHEISEEIINMMKSNSNVYLEKEQPYCCLSGFQKNCVELTLGCNLEPMDEDELLLVKQDVLFKSTEIIKKHDATFDEQTGT